MGFAVDHLFVMCDVGAPEAGTLLDIGLAEAAPNRHPGQGTANRRFFFENAYLELLWIESPEEARAPEVSRTGLLERWLERRRRCPFGVVLRREGGAEPLPFPTWRYRPSYLPPEFAIDVAARVTLDEPAVFCLDLAGAPRRIRSDATGNRREPRLLTGLRMSLAADAPLSESSRALERIGLVSFERAAPPAAVLEFDGGRGGQAADLRPRLPMSLQW